MSELDSFLNHQRDAGEHRSSGQFLISLEKARKKRADYALERPEFWVLRLLQGLTKLQAVRVEVLQDRVTFTVRAQLDRELCMEESLHDLFRISQTEDKRMGVQDAVWGALGKGLKVNLGWRESGAVHEFEATKNDIQLVKSKADLGPWNLSFQVVPAVRASLLQKMFKTVNYAGEFQAIGSRAYLVPYKLTMDNRPYTLDPGEILDGAKHWELRAHRAKEGPRLRGYLHSELGQLGESGRDASFLLLARWSPGQPRGLRVHWFKDGIFLSRELTDFHPSALCLDLYLSADGLQTDLSRLRLVRDELLAERIDDFKLQTSLSLGTNPLVWPNSQQPPNHCEVRSAIASFCDAVFKEAFLKRRNLQKFQNSPELTRDYNEKVRRHNDASSFQLQVYEESLKRWENRNKADLAKLLIQDRALFQNNVLVNKGVQSWQRLDDSLVAASLDGVIGHGALPPVHPGCEFFAEKSLLGDIYVKLPGSSPTSPPSAQLLKSLPFRKS